jgi:hypothetical protein
MSGLISAVDVESFRKAFDIFYEAIHEAEPEDREQAWIFALYEAVPREDFMTFCGRIAMLDDVIHSHRAEVSAHQGFPSEWVDIAATAPLTFGKNFKSSLFRWPKVAA